MSESEFYGASFLLIALAIVVVGVRWAYQPRYLAAAFVLVLAALAVLFVGCEAHAGYYAVGTVQDGHTFKNGYWYQGNTPYYRTVATSYSYVPQYQYNGYGGYSTYYVQQPSYSYSYEAVEQPYAAPAAAPYAKGWQGKLLDIAAARDKVEGALRSAALDHQSYLGAVQALGLNGNFHWQNYGMSPGYPASAAASPSSYSSVPYVANGNTLYGYSYSSVKDLYGDTNLGSLYQQAARLTQNAQTLAGQATGDFSDIVQKEGSNRSRVAEILAKAQAAAVALQAANPQPSAHTESRAFSFRTEASADGGTNLVPVPVEPGQGQQQQQYQQPAQQQYQQAPQMPYATSGAGAAAAGQDQFPALLQARCAACHSGGNARGGFTAAAYLQMSPAEKARRVWPRLVATDLAKRMPLGPNNTPGAPLTPEELRLFFAH